MRFAGNAADESAAYMGFQDGRARVQIPPFERPANASSAPDKIRDANVE
jgi:hypothetical protein